MKSKKVAIVCDWLVGGGAEMVVLELHKIYPEAPIYTSYCSDEWRQKLDQKVVTGWLQNFGRLRKFIPFLRIWYFTHLKFNEFDLVISSSGAEAKGIKVADNTLHVNYCHAPTHYYWARYEQYLANPGFGIFNWLARFGLRLLVGPLRRWDFKAAQRPKVIIANSNFTKDQIKKYYRRSSSVIYPPVDIEYFKPQKSVKRSGFVVVGRQTPYKRIDLAVSACGELGLPLAVVGNGPEHQRLKKMAGPTIKFVPNATRQQVAEHLQSAQGFIFPGIDDFGIAAVEAMAAGTPVIAYRAGGALDYVVENKTGMFFEDQVSDSLKKVLQNFARYDFDHDKISKDSNKFGAQQFIGQINQLIGADET